MSNFPLIAIVGRPNVGKSTLFNRLVGSRRAIVGDEPGITRDRLYGEAHWLGHDFRVVDTGGIIPDDRDFIPSEIFRQARVALDESAAIVMVVDGRTELAASDLELARLLRKAGKPIFLAVNKVDSGKQESLEDDFHGLGIRDIHSISAEHGRGIDDLLDAATGVFPAMPSDAADGEGTEERRAGRELAHSSSGSKRKGRRDEVSTAKSEKSDDRRPVVVSPDLSEEMDVAVGEDEFPHDELHVTKDEFHSEEVAESPAPTEVRVAIIGHPNVGKSTLLNKLTGSDRAIVSPIPGTTRDAIDEVVERDGKTFRFIDTAGIRRKGKTHLMAAKLSVVMSRKHLEAADIALLVIDAVEGVTSLDATIRGYAHESGRVVDLDVEQKEPVSAARAE